MHDHVATVITDKQAQLVVHTALECAGFACDAFPSIAALLRGVRRDDTRIVIVDVDEPSVDWRTLVDWRHNWLNPSVLLFALGAADGAATASVINVGVDDYIRRPVHGAELLARVTAAQRRGTACGTAGQASSSIELAGCLLHRPDCSLRSRSCQVRLTARELGIAQLLFEEVGRVVTRQRLANEVWGAAGEWIGHTIEQHIYQIRRKLQLCSSGRLVLRGVYGQGYRLELAPAGDAAPYGPPKQAARRGLRGSLSTAGQAD